jgi:hypothetical protein
MPSVFPYVAGAVLLWDVFGSVLIRRLYLSHFQYYLHSPILHLVEVVWVVSRCLAVEGRYVPPILNVYHSFVQID